MPQVGAEAKDLLQAAPLPKSTSSEVISCWAPLLHTSLSPQILKPSRLTHPSSLMLLYLEA